MEHIRDIEIILKLLVTPSSFDQTSSQHSSLESCFKLTLESVENHIKENVLISWLKDAIISHDVDGPEDDIYWNFASFCLKVLLVLRNELDILRQQHKETKSDLGPDVLSIQMQKAVRNVLQFVICLGISRNLLPGVGTPLQAKSKFGSLLLENNGQNFSALNKYQMLLSTTNALMTCSRNPTLGSLIFTQHLGDVLAALCQLSYAPLKEFDCVPKTVKVPNLSLGSSNTIGTCNTKLSPPVVSNHDEIREHQLSSRKILDQLIDKLYQPLVMRELLVLQGPHSSQTKSAGITSYKSPCWLKTASRQLLSKQLTKKNGLKALIEAILGLSDPEEVSTQHFIQKCNTVAKIIANPVNPTSKEAYFESICPQVLNLFHLKDVGCNHSVFRVASLTFSIIALAEPTIAEIYLIKPLLRPLLACCCDQGVTCKPTEDEMSFCITVLHKMCVINFESNDPILKVLSPLFGVLMNIFSFVNTGVSHLRSILEELLCYFLKHADSSHVLIILKDWLYSFGTNSEVLRWNNQLTLKYGNNGGVTVADLTQSERNQHEWLESDESKVNATLTLLSQLHNEKIVMEFFLDTLEELSLLVQSLDASSIKRNEGSPSTELLYIEERDKQERKELQKSLKILKILSALCEQPSLLESLLLDKEKMIQFVMSTLERGAKLCEKEECALMDTETLTIAMTVLSMVAQCKDTSLIKVLKCCLPPLKVLADLHRNQEIRTLAASLYNFIITYGAVHPEGNLHNDGLNQKFNTSQALDNESKSDSVCNDICKEVHTDSNHDVGKLTDFHQAWHDLHNTEPPIKGHAMILLSKLLQSKDPETLANKDKLLTAFQNNLNNDDTYIYLTAIRSLSCLVDAFPDVVLPCLIRHYSDTENMTSEMRLKVGEVLMKTLKALGDITPRYRDLLLGAFLKTTNDSDPLVRASTLSCLGDLCKELRYSLGPFVHQVVNAFMNFMKYDKSLEVRRAATQSIAVMFRGMGKDTLKILEDNLKDIYQHLKLIYNCDKDDIMKLHAQLALEELDIICRDCLFPKQKFEKKIAILESL